MSDSLETTSEALPIAGRPEPAETARQASPLWLSELPFADNANIWGALAVLALMAYLGAGALHGWWPHDDGMLAHAAERVYAGEWPHRDFDEVYTGGLSLLHALSFAIWGIQLASMRYLLLIACVPFIVVIYLLALRVGKPPAAAIVTCLAVAWSLPNYQASMPSWYNLFFATFGVWALCRHLDTGRARWLALAGIFGGLSILIKIVGVYYLAAVLCYLVDYARRSRSDQQGPERRSVGYAILVSLALGMFIIALAILIRHHATPMNVLAYVLPATLLACYLIWSEWRFGFGRSVDRALRLARLIVPFTAGACLPLALFLVPYVWSGATDELLRGVFVLPLRRMTEAAYSLPPLVTLLSVVPLALLMVLPVFRPIRSERPLAVAVGLALAVWLIACGYNILAYRVVWYAVRPLVMVLAVAATLILARSDLRGGLSRQHGSEIFLLAIMSALVSLVQYPFSAHLYFFYVAPLVVIGLLYVAAAQRFAPWRLHACACAFYLLFALVWMNRCYIFTIGGQFMHLETNSSMPSARGGIGVTFDDQVIYSRVLAEVRAHSAPGTYIYAAPDCPAVYFLTDRKNPTRTIYDLFDDPADRNSRILKALKDHDVSTVVVNTESTVSQPFDRQLHTEIEKLYPQFVQISYLVVRWR